MNFHHIWAGFFILYIISYTAGSWSDTGSPSCDRDNMISLPPSVSNPGKTESAQESHSLHARQSRAARPPWSGPEGHDLNSHGPALLVHRSAPSFVEFTERQLRSLVWCLTLIYITVWVRFPHLSATNWVALLHSLRASLYVAALCCFMKVVGIKDK